LLLLLLLQLLLELLYLLLLELKLLVLLLELLLENGRLVLEFLVTPGQRVGDLLTLLHLGQRLSRFCTPRMEIIRKLTASASVHVCVVRPAAVVEEEALWASCCLRKSMSASLARSASSSSL
jgi:hypothetical protein